MSSVSRGDGTVTLGLPDLQWVNRYSYSALAVAQSTGITGKVLRAESVRIHGRPIHLRQPASNIGVVPLATVRQIQGWAAEPGKALTFTYFGETHAVMFGYPAIVTAEPLIGWTDEDDGEWWRLEFDLITVA